MSAHRCPCPLVVSCVHVSWPVSVRCCLCPHVIAHARAFLPMSARCCPCPHVVAHVRTSLPTSVHVHGWSFPFVGVGGSLRLWAMARCGGGEPLVGGGDPRGWCRCVVVWLLWSRLYFTLPHRFHMDSTWTPSGKELNLQFRTKSIWSPLGLHLDSRWNPSGLHMEFTYSILSSCICTYI